MFDVETVEFQLSELATLESIYPHEDEVKVKDIHDLSVMKEYVETNGASLIPSKNLHVTLSTKLDDKSNSVLRLECSLPSTYPKASLPNVFIRCDVMARNMQQKFNSDLSVFMQTIELGEGCIYQILQWAIENAPEYISNTDAELSETTGSACNNETKPYVFSRMWIYSHHIYSKEKRKCILEWAKELHLTGFSMPGKPGVICVEGIQENCEDYWQRVKRLSWKQIDVRCREEMKAAENKFENMAEIAFQVHGQRSNHMDMGAFYNYLVHHSSEAMFLNLFGIAGKSKAAKQSG